MAHEDTQYLKLSTFHKVMAATKANVILIIKDTKDWLEWFDEHWH
jgi:hypothetical protein